MKMGVSEPLADSYPNSCSETQNCLQNLDIIVLENLQGINPMVLSTPLENYKANNDSETQNCHQNIEMIALKKLIGVKSMGLSALWPTLKTTFILKQQTITKTLILWP